MDPSPPSPRPADVNLRYLVPICLVATVGGLLFGFDTGVISGAIEPLTARFGLGDFMKGWASGCVLIGCAAGVLLVGPLSDRFGRKPALFLAALMFVASAVGTALAQQVSVFIVFRFIGDYTPIQILGTFKPLWLPAWFGNAFCIFLLRQFFLTIPDELGEAARIDGCSEWGIFWRIVLPLSRPALAVVALLTFMSSWNNFQGPLIFLQSPQQYTLALGLQTFQSQQNGTDWNLLMAASLLVMLPVLVLFIITQRFFVEGIATTGIK